MLKNTEGLVLPEKIHGSFDLGDLRFIDSLNLLGVAVKHGICFKKISINELERLAGMYSYLKNQILTDSNMGYHEEY